MKKTATSLTLSFLSVVLFAACGEAESDPSMTEEESPSVDSPVESVAEPLTAAQVCTRWNNDRANVSEGTWSGNEATCTAGDTTGRANALKLVNLYRYLAGFTSPIATDATKSSQAQKCALMMDANNQLSHAPPANWKCYTSAGATAAGKSNISGGPGVMSVDLYMKDNGNADTMGHRRWLLANKLGPIGIGSTSQYSCHQVIGGTGSETRTYSAWPPPGAVPIQAITKTIPEVYGWTVQSDSINLGNTTSVKVTDNGAAVSFNFTKLPTGYGSTYAIRFVPADSAWRMAAGHNYVVKVFNGATVLASYTVSPVTC